MCSLDADFVSVFTEVVATSTPTRDRILDAAMTLFSAHGFRGTSVTQIERAAGLTPGAGGIYHHFKTKDALLSAGVQRHLRRLRALHDIRELFVGVGDFRTELLLTARFVLAELDREEELLRIVALESRSNPEALGDAREQLVEKTFHGFAGWLAAAAGVPAERADPVAAVALGALLSNRLLRALELRPAAVVDDEIFLSTWVEMVIGAVGAG